MGSISRQFFALPEELVEITEAWKDEFNFYLVIMQLFPETKVFEIAGFNELEELPIDLEDVYCVFLGRNTPNLNINDRYDFVMKNPDFLTLDFGKVTSNSLGESWLSGVTDKPDLQKLWDKMGRQLRKKTKGGMWAINTEYGRKHFYRDLRYTPGACNLSKKGIKLLTAANDPVVYLSVDEPQCLASVPPE